MKTNYLKVRLAALFGLLALYGSQANAAAPFTESADAAFYDTGWANGSSQPNNFGWFVSTFTSINGFAGRFVGSSPGLDGGNGGNIDTNNRSLGMYAGRGGPDPTSPDPLNPIYGTGLSDAYGFLKDGSGNDASLSVGQTLSLNIAVNWRNGFKGVAFRNSSGTELMTFVTGGDDYNVYNAATGNGSIGNAWSGNTVFNISVTQTSVDGGTWTITRSGGLTDSDSGTYSGVIWNLKAFVGDTDGGSPNDLFVNSVSVTDPPPPNNPTPATITSTNRLGDGTFQLDFNGVTGTAYTVLSNADLDAPVSTWTVLGTATETSPGSGQFQYIDSDAPNFARRYYSVSNQ